MNCDECGESVPDNIRLCPDCGVPKHSSPNCDHRLDEPINDIWKDPNVKMALKDGRSADDIMVLDCPKCGRYGYWNQGQHFSCRFCNLGFYCVDNDHPGPIGIRKVFMENAVTLADTVTITTDGYDNETLPRQ